MLMLSAETASVVVDESIAVELGVVSSEESVVLIGPGIELPCPFAGAALLVDAASEAAVVVPESLTPTQVQ